MDIQAVLQKYIQEEVLTGRKTSVGADQSLIGSGILDSVRLLQLISFVEKRFGIQFPDEEMIAENFKTISRITAVIESKVRAAREPKVENS